MEKLDKDKKMTLNDGAVEKNTQLSRFQMLNLYENEEELQKIASALSVKTRRDIIKLINQGPRSVNDVAWGLNIPVSTASFHVKTLVDCGILDYSTNSKKRGNEKLVILKNYIFDIKLVKNNPDTSSAHKTFMQEIPIGSFSSFNAKPPCGMVVEGLPFLADNPALFHHPLRAQAKQIWLSEGYFEYTVPILNHFANFDDAGNKVITPLDKSSITSVGFTFEICSETALFNHNFKSDITLSVCGNQLHTFLSKGDFGERRGRLTPEWMTEGFTQYGILCNLDVRFDGTYFNEVRVNDFCVDDLCLVDRDTLSLKIEVKNDAKHVGGFNLFGKDFGDYPQDILLSVTYK